MNHIIGRDVYEIYIYIADSKNIASGLLLKEYKSKVMANIYYKYLKFLISRKKLSRIIKTVEK